MDYIEALEEKLKFFQERKEEKSFQLTMYQYCNALINSYWQVKQNIDDTEELQKSLLKNFRSSVKKIVLYPAVHLKSKIRFVFACVFPNLYGRIILQ